MPSALCSSHSVTTIRSVSENGPTRVSQSNVTPIPCVSGEVNRISSASCIQRACEDMSETCLHTSPIGAAVTVLTRMLIRPYPIAGRALVGLIVVPVLLAAQLRWHDPGIPSRPTVALAQVSRSEPVSPCLPQSLQTAALQDLNYCNTGVEPRVAVDPRTVSGGRPVIIGVWQQDRFQNGGASALMAASSRDGGRTWDRTCLPFTLCVSRGIRAEAASDPLVSIGPDGTAYATGLILSVTRLNRSQGVVVATSRDGGTSWGNVQAIVRDSLTQLSDKESVTADPVHAGVAYVIWDRTGLAGGRFSQPPWFSRTMDHGRHWSTPRPIPGVPGLTIGHQIVVDPRTDTLYDVFSRVNQSKHEFCQPEREDCANPPSDSDIALIRSTDMGLTWSAPAVIARNRAVGPGKGLGIQVRVGTRVPEAALDPVTGRLYVVFEDP